MKIIFLDSFTITMDGMPLTSLENLGGFQTYNNTSSKKIVSRALDADVIITNKVVIDAEIMDQLPNLKYICVSATGYNNVDIAYARSKGIPVSNVSGYSTDSVAQHVFSLLFHALTNVAYYDEEVMDGRWQNSELFTFYDHSIQELSGMTMGIYGLGTIGNKVASIAHAFGMNVIATSRNTQKEKPDYVKFVILDELIAQADVLTLHSALDDTNKEVIDSKILEKMKKSAILINTARGGLVHESDLANALNDEKISFACLDVLSEEPPSSSNPLLEAKNCIITPHIAWASLSARNKLVNGIAANIQAFRKGEELQNIINK